MGVFHRSRGCISTVPTLPFRPVIHKTGLNSPLSQPGSGGLLKQTASLGSHVRTTNGTIIPGQSPGTPCAAGRPGNRAGGEIRD